MVVVVLSSVILVRAGSVVVKTDYAVEGPFVANVSNPLLGLLGLRIDYIWYPDDHEWSFWAGRCWVVGARSVNTDMWPMSVVRSYGHGGVGHTGKAWWWVGWSVSWLVGRAGGWLG